MKYKRSTHFNVGMITRRTRRSKYESVSRKVKVRIASNGGVGPFIWEGTAKTMKQWQRTSERHRREAFKSVIEAVNACDGRLDEIDVYPATGKHAREPIAIITPGLLGVRLDTVLEMRDALPGRVYQSAMECTAVFPNKPRAIQFQRACERVLEGL